ncbi:hypothetical protein K3495_g483 [Podosphaera aphanis]|nr:hypothetical protein K3495_g483 [Podosphaera aphanis]
MDAVDPDCAICSQPAAVNCMCEARGLDIAVKQAEQKMMTSVNLEIRSWVRIHARDHILAYFNMLKRRREEVHARNLNRLHDHAAYYYHRPPHPSDLALADAEHKRGVDEDWKLSVQRYPEVLEYFYGLVEFTLPSDDDPNVSDPQIGGDLNLGASNSSDPEFDPTSRDGRKVRLRENIEVEERRRRRHSRTEERVSSGRVREREREVEYGMGPIDLQPPPPQRGYSYTPGY